jgi:hypothetical protein
MCVLPKRAPETSIRIIGVVLEALLVLRRI